MKRLVSFTVFLFWVGAGTVSAQNKPPVAGLTPKITPFIVSPNNGKIPATSPNMHSVNLQVRAQMKQIQDDLKSGKMTKDQAKGAFVKLRTVRQQELKFIRRNGQKEITPDQKIQLEQMISLTRK
jgi:hypothetical protein